MEKTTVTLNQFDRLLTDLLEYSRVRTSSFDMGAVEIAPLIKRIKEEQSEMIKESGANISMYGALPEIQINESRAYQIFSNLISNCLKFTRDGIKPEIGIGIIHDPKEMLPAKHNLLFVTDNGVGIDTVWHDKIFGLFVQVDKTSSEGSGAGLAIVRRIVEQENGKIWVESTPGSGTTFYFTLPTAG